ncbi:cytochrome b/b6 domain-containing protein [Rhodophyticola porphyridii]|uniref:Cytochrome n=1 Tax=Rhodophyticola porphyridii TaxID=1852017 RepID=A0A3L9XZW8_9RHOB|nr:cytochrome b/b6 domain-containing protein [Rhodophyticola porphyridii]RMA42151.1 cytochrome [Rhodophyticola porphyridii]
MTATDARPDHPGPRNSSRRYGSVAKTLHWLTALLLLTAIPLGLVANAWPYDSSAQLAVKALLFSLHKTIGLLAFFVALARIFWAAIQPRPQTLISGRPIQVLLADATHLVLYASLVIVPLSGWLHHAATTGFAPIWWPFGQTLPFVPQSEAVAGFFAAWHWLFTKLLAAAILLHIIGALKHHYIDRDATLARMLPGQPALPDRIADGGAGGHHRAIILAIAIWVLALAGGTLLGLQTDDRATIPRLAEVQSEWAVRDGTLEITVQQLGSAVTGSFADWTAEIDFAEAPSDGLHGRVDVVIAIGSLSLGGVTTQALDAEFFNAAVFPTARFSGPIRAADQGYVVDGVLSLAGRDVPAVLPFTLAIADDTATVSGQVTLDRRDFGMGPSYPDESSMGFGVDVRVALTAVRAEAE